MDYPEDIQYNMIEPVQKNYMEESNMNIGDKIKELRKANKLTQEQLGEYLNVSSQAVSKWETGSSSPDIEMLPRIASFFGITIDELMDFDRQRIMDEVDELVAESVPLRKDPAKAEAFYREALKKYPNNEVLLNCLLMVIPNERSKEKIEIAERLLDVTRDDDIRIDVLRLTALTYHNIGEDAMAEYYLEKIPELYFLKTEIAAAVRQGEARMEEIRKTENVCLSTLAAMLALRIEEQDDKKLAKEYMKNAEEIMTLYEKFEDQRTMAGMLKEKIKDGTLLDFYK